MNVASLDSLKIFDNAIELLNYKKQVLEQKQSISEKDKNKIEAISCVIFNNITTNEDNYLFEKYMILKGVKEAVTKKFLLNPEMSEQFLNFLEDSNDVESLRSTKDFIWDIKNEMVPPIKRYYDQMCQLNKTFDCVFTKEKNYFQENFYQFDYPKENFSIDNASLLSLRKRAICLVLRFGFMQTLSIFLNETFKYLKNTYQLQLNPLCVFHLGTIGCIFDATSLNSSQGLACYLKMNELIIQTYKLSHQNIVKCEKYKKHSNSEIANIGRFICSFNKINNSNLFLYKNFTHLFSFYKLFQHIFTSSNEESIEDKKIFYLSTLEKEIFQGFKEEIKDKLESLRAAHGLFSLTQSLSDTDVIKRANQLREWYLLELPHQLEEFKKIWAKLTAQRNISHDKRGFTREYMSESSSYSLIEGIKLATYTDVVEKTLHFLIQKFSPYVKIENVKIEIPVSNRRIKKKKAQNNKRNTNSNNRLRTPPQNQTIAKKQEIENRPIVNVKALKFKFPQLQFAPRVLDWLEENPTTLEQPSYAVLSPYRKKLQAAFHGYSNAIYPFWWHSHVSERYNANTHVINKCHRIFGQMIIDEEVFRGFFNICICTATQVVFHKGFERFDVTKSEDIELMNKAYWPVDFPTLEESLKLEENKLKKTKSIVAERLYQGPFGTIEVARGRFGEHITLFKWPKSISQL